MSHFVSYGETLSSGLSYSALDENPSRWLIIPSQECPIE